MKVVKFSGGLGNQLFQYGFYLALCEKTSCQVYVDFSFYRKQNIRKPIILDIFPQLKSLDVSSLPIYYKLAYKTLTLADNIFLGSRHIYHDKENGFNPEVFKAKSTIYDGYWQSFKYFDNFQNEFKEAFDKINLPTNLITLKNKIHKGDNLSLHIRRGDYVNSSEANLFHGVCDMLYYLRAIDYIESCVGKIDKIYVFSDDIPWAESNVNFDIDTEIVDTRDCNEPDYIDMILFGSAKYNVTANSTYSLWGAYLNRHVSGVVVSPEKWFAHESSMLDDLYIKESIVL